MKRIGALFLVLSILGVVLMAGCKIGKQSTSGVPRATPAAQKK